MTHRRDEIEKDVEKLLKNNTLAKENVFPLSEAFFQDDLEIKISYFSPEEKIKVHAVAPRSYQRTMVLNVTAMFIGQGVYSKFGNQLTSEIEKIMLSNQIAKNFDREIQLVRTEQEIGDKGEEQRSALNLQYEIQYITEEDYPPKVDALNSIFTAL